MNELDFGNLVIKFVNKFKLAWWDKGSGGKYDEAYYKPIVPLGDHALGGEQKNGCWEINNREEGEDREEGEEGEDRFDLGDNEEGEDY